MLTQLIGESQIGGFIIGFHKGLLTTLICQLGFQKPAPTNEQKGQNKTGKQNDKGKLGQDYPVIEFLADLSHRVRAFAKYLYALKNTTMGQSEMNDINFLRLKRNCAWWIFSGVNLTYKEFEQSAGILMLHQAEETQEILLQTKECKIVSSMPRDCCPLFPQRTSARMLPLDEQPK
jgi:hypothetical protein